MGVGGPGGSPYGGTAADTPPPSVHDDGSPGSSGMEQAKAVVTVKVEVTLVCARGLKNTRKLLGRMSPCAVVTVPGTQLRETSRPDEQGGTNPHWNQTITFAMPEALLLRSTDPKPAAVHVELFDGPARHKSLGSAVLPLAPAITHYEEDPLTATAWVTRKGRPRGELTYALRCCGRPSFAPLKSNAEEYQRFVAALLLPQPPPPPRPTEPSQPARDPGKGSHAAHPHPHPPSQFEAYRPHGPPMLYPTYGADSRGHAFSQPTTAPASAPAVGYPASPYQTPMYPVQPQYPGYSPYPYVQTAPPAPMFVGHARGGGYGGYDYRHGRRGGGMGGFGTGMLAGALGGLLLGDALDGDIGDFGF